MALLNTRRLLEDLQNTAFRQPILSALAAIGGIYAASTLYSLASFVQLHFLHRSRLHRYLDPDGSPSWALVTGASDGLGRGFAEELLNSGFDVILHGRNPIKLERVKRELLKQWPSRQIEVLVLDAMVDVEDREKMKAAAERCKTLKLKVLVNNVAGELHPLFMSHAERSSEQNRKLMNGNFIFATEITRLLLPQLLCNKPALILNIGSGSARLPCPYIAVAAASKTFLESFSHTLAVEMIAAGHPEVEVLYDMVGLCSTGSEPRPVTFLVPDSRPFAKSSLRLVGCGHRTVWGYWPHALQFEPLLKLPQSLIERICVGLVRQLRADENEKRLKAG